LTDLVFSVSVTVSVIFYFSVTVIVTVNLIIFFSYFAISVTVTINLNNIAPKCRLTWMKFGGGRLLHGIHLWLQFDSDRCMGRRLQAKRKLL